MSMLPDGIIPIETGKDGQVLDFVWTTNHALITDYYRLDEKIIAENDSVVKTAGRQNRMEIASIKELKSALAKFVTESKKNTATLYFVGLFKSVYYFWLQ